MGSLPLLLKFDDFCLLGVMVYWLLLWFFINNQGTTRKIWMLCWLLNLLDLLQR